MKAFTIWTINELYAFSKISVVWSPIVCVYVDRNLVWYIPLKDDSLYISHILVSHYMLGLYA